MENQELKTFYLTVGQWKGVIERLNREGYLDTARRLEIALFKSSVPMVVECDFWIDIVEEERKKSDPKKQENEDP